MIGLIRSVLSQLFGALAKAKKPEDKIWLRGLITFIIIVLAVSGLVAYLKLTRSPVLSSPIIQSPTQNQANQVHQDSTGQGSPNVQGVQGDVHIDIDQSDGKVKSQKPADSKSEEKIKDRK